MDVYVCREGWCTLSLVPRPLPERERAGMHERCVTRPSLFLGGPGYEASTHFGRHPDVNSQLNYTYMYSRIKSVTCSGKHPQ